MVYKIMASSRPPEGYPRLAACMKESPEIAIFRRFGDLNVQNLLYLQSELNHMLEDYRDIVQEDYDSKDPKREVLSRRWIELSRSRGDQWEKWLDIRSKLEHYSQGQPVQETVATVSLAHTYLHRSSAYSNKPALPVQQPCSTTIGHFTQMA